MSSCICLTIQIQSEEDILQHVSFALLPVSQISWWMVLDRQRRKGFQWACQSKKVYWSLLGEEKQTKKNTTQESWRPWHGHFNPPTAKHLQGSTEIYRELLMGISHIAKIGECSRWSVLESRAVWGKIFSPFFRCFTSKAITLRNRVNKNQRIYQPDTYPFQSRSAIWP